MSDLGARPCGFSAVPHTAYTAEELSSRYILVARLLLVERQGYKDGAPRAHLHDAIATQPPASGPGTHGCLVGGCLLPILSIRNPRPTARPHPPRRRWLGMGLHGLCTLLMLDVHVAVLLQRLVPKEKAEVAPKGNAKSKRPNFWTLGA